MTVPEGEIDLFGAETSMFPATLTELFDGLPITIFPGLLLTPWAIILPVEPILTAPRLNPIAVAADNFTIPPLAFNVPLLFIRLFSVFPSTSVIVDSL